nr:ABC transporter substrate-binding protein [Ancylobacter lacus]
MHRRQFLVTGATALAAAGWSRPGRADGGAFRILMVTPGGEGPAERGFRDYLATENIPAELVPRSVGGDLAGVAALRADIPGLAPDLVYTSGAPVTLALAGPYDAPDASDFIRDRPLVFALVAFPLQDRLARSLEAPGGNVTGASSAVPPEVQLRAMQSYRPFSTVGILHSNAGTQTLALIAQTRAFCAANRLRLVEQVFAGGPDGRPTAEGLAGRVSQLKADGAEWLYLVPDPFLSSVYGPVTAAARALELPTFGASEAAVRAGALAGLVARAYSVGQLAASQAAEILVQHRAAGTIPIQPLKRFSLTINIGVAKALGIFPPIEMLNSAEIIG